MHNDQTPGDGNETKLEISIMSQGEFAFHTATETGLKFKDETPEGEWLQITEQVSKMWEGGQRLTRKAALFLGDCLAFGERYGQKHSQAIDGFRMHLASSGSVKYLENIASICRSVAPEIRGDVLSIAHLDVVARLEPEEQKTFIGQAEKEAMTVKELRYKVKEAHPPKKSKKTAKKPKETAIIDLEDEQSMMLAAQKLGEWLESYLAKNPDGMAAKQAKQWEARISDIIIACRGIDSDELARVMAEESASYLERTKETAPVAGWSDARRKAWAAPMKSMANAADRFRRAQKAKEGAEA